MGSGQGIDRGMIELSKKCSKCGEVKLLGEFGFSKRGNSCVIPYCRECEQKQEIKWANLISGRNVK